MLATFAPSDVPAGFRRIGDVREPAPAEEPRMLVGAEPIAREGFDHFG